MLLKIRNKVAAIKDQITRFYAPHSRLFLRHSLDYELSEALKAVNGVVAYGQWLTFKLGLAEPRVTPMKLWCYVDKTPDSWALNTNIWERIQPEYRPLFLYRPLNIKVYFTTIDFNEWPNDCPKWNLYTNIIDIRCFDLPNPHAVTNGHLMDFWSPLSLRFLATNRVRRMNPAEVLNRWQMLC